MKMIANYIIIEINIKAESKGKVRVSSHSDKRGERSKNAYYLNFGRTTSVCESDRQICFLLLLGRSTEI